MKTNEKTLCFRVPQSSSLKSSGVEIGAKYSKNNLGTSSFRVAIENGRVTFQLLVCTRVNGVLNKSKMSLAFCIIIVPNSQKTFSLLFSTPTWPPMTSDASQGHSRCDVIKTSIRELQHARRMWLRERHKTIGRMNKNKSSARPPRALYICIRFCGVVGLRTT